MAVKPNWEQMATQLCSASLNTFNPYPEDAKSSHSHLACGKLGGVMLAKQPTNS
jgi:hypothetical protein